MTTYRNGRRQQYSEDPARWREDPRTAKGAAQLDPPLSVPPADRASGERARLEAAVRRISSLDEASCCAGASVGVARPDRGRGALLPIQPT